MSKIFFIISILFLFVSCENIVNEGDINSSQKYPSQVGREWEYNTIIKVEYYDTLGGFDSTSVEDLGNTIVRIVKDKDSVGAYSNLILFEDFDLTTPQNIHKIWYLNTDSGFYAIAYWNAGASQPVVPKQGNFTLHQFKELIKIIGITPYSSTYFSINNFSADTIQYFNPSRKVLAYPLYIGSRWIELIQPFYRERFIRKQEIVTVNGTSYSCYKIESDKFFIQTEFNDYISLSSGLIKRELISDSMLYTEPSSPDVINYMKWSSISKMVREKK